MDINNTVIICIMGESGSGKSTAAAALRDKLDYNYIKSYTTRKPRYPGEDTHIFVERAPDFFDPDLVVERHHHNGHDYWTEYSQFKKHYINIHVIEPEGARHLAENWAGPVLRIYLKTNREERQRRMVAEDRKITDIITREHQDRKLFEVVECDYAIEANDSPEAVTDRIREIIWRWLG
jgi:guanylate kinase